MHTLIADFPVKAKRINNLERDCKSVARGDIFHIVREKEVSRGPKKRNLSMYCFDVKESQSLKSATAFQPSHGVTLFVQDSVLKARQEQHSVVKVWLNSVKDLISRRSIQFDETYSRRDSHSLPATRAWLSQKIGYYVDNIAASASENGLAVYQLTENGKLRTEVAKMLAQRLGLSGDGNFKFVSLLRDDLWRAGLDNSIRGSWGTLNISRGELVVDTSKDGAPFSRQRDRQVR